MSASYLLKNGIAVIQMSMPPLNSLSLKLREGLFRGIERATSVDKARGIVITSTGTKIFSNGYDTIETIKGTIHQKPSLGELHTCIEAQTVPVVAAFNGSAFGSALELGLSCHYRIATTHSQFGFTDSNIGLVPGAGGLIRFPRVIKNQKSPILTSLDYLISGRTFDSREAEDIGLVDHVFDASSDAEVINNAVRFLNDEVSNEGKSATWLTDKVLSKKNMSAFALPKEVLDDLSARINKEYPGLQAPHAIVAAVMASMNIRSDDAVSTRNALLIEEKLHSALFKGTQFKALQYFYHSEKKFRQQYTQQQSLEWPKCSLNVSSPSKIHSVNGSKLTIDREDARLCYEAWDKLAPFIKSDNGLFGNRLLDTYIHEAIMLLLEGASVSEIDSALESRLGWKVGPIGLLDLMWKAGGSVSFEVLYDNVNGFDDDTNLSVYSQSRKFLRDVFSTSSGKVYDPIAQLITKHLEKLKEEKKIIKRKDPITAEEIEERCMYVLVNECYRIIDESGKVVSSSLLDFVFVYGYGFPKYRGGVMWWAERECKMTNVALGLAKYYAKSVAQSQSDGSSNSNDNGKGDQRYNRCQLIEDTVSGQAILREEQYFRKK